MRTPARPSGTRGTLAVAVVVCLLVGGVSAARAAETWTVEIVSPINGDRVTDRLAPITIAVGASGLLRGESVRRALRLETREIDADGRLRWQRVNCPKGCQAELPPASGDRYETRMTLSMPLKSQYQQIRAVVTETNALGLESPLKESDPPVEVTADFDPQLLVLLIGVSTYETEEAAQMQRTVPRNLCYPEMDLLAMQEYFSKATVPSYKGDEELLKSLRKPPVFDVLMGAKATATEIPKAVKRLVGKATFADTMIVFFSGHGWVRPGRSPDGFYLIPADGWASDDPRVHEEHNVNFADLIRPIERLLRGGELGRAVVILDTCHSGAAESYQGSIGIFSSTLRGDKALDTVDGVCRHDGGERQGLFVSLLLERLFARASNPGPTEQTVSFAELEQAVKRAMAGIPGIPRQKPEYKGYGNGWVLPVRSR